MKLIMVTLGLSGARFTDFVFMKACEDGKYRLSLGDMDRLFIKHFGRLPYQGENVNLG